VYPVVDHVADKVMAILQRYGETQAPSTRYKDLVDLVAILSEAPIEVNSQRTALLSEGKRRDVALPVRFDVPHRELWDRGYASEAGRSLLPIARTLDEALAIVRAFLDPVLSGNAEGVWNPKSGRWEI
jgi:Nucleotidyl transferase AbiEii toxin, Type IV TA system